MSMGLYVLEGHTPVPCSDMARWGEMFRDIKARRVAESQVADFWVSTVFLGLDHSFGEGPPLLFETMVFSEDGETIGRLDRYATWDEAAAGHELMIALCTDEIIGSQFDMQALITKIQEKKCSRS